MMKQYFVWVLPIVFIWAIVSCNDKDAPIPTPKPPTTEPKEKINAVSQFVYDGLAAYYKWADEMVSKKPTLADNDPEKYFYSLRSRPDIEHGWSWITDDVAGLLKGFSGKSFSFGYDITFMKRNESQGTFYAIVRYVFPNTPATDAAIKRLDIIGEIDGTPITEDNYRQLFSGEKTLKLTLYKLVENEVVMNKEITITPREINTNPVLVDSIYTVNDKKIGYLFYTGFIRNYNEELFKSFSKFKSAGVNELVLDLRYNRGGSISAASYLASMIAPATAVQNNEVLSKLSYNDDINAVFDKNNWSRSSRLGVYDNKNFSNPLDANLNLSRVYIIATRGSYSASELTTFCLKPYMEVVHIGNKTGGKYTASWTLHPYKNFSGRAQAIYKADKVSEEDKKALENWAMQPIVAVYTDKNNETFMKTDGLIPKAQNTMKEGFGRLGNWKPLGDPKDTFLGQVFYLITGEEAYKPVPLAATKSHAAIATLIDSKPNTLADKIQQESVLIDNISLNPEMFRKITAK